jgi:L-seryl-tRNA(Ser) seleniumtransferase
VSEDRIEDLRALPAVSALLSRPEVGELVRAHGHATVVRALRDTVARAREVVRAGGAITITDGDIRERVVSLSSARLRCVLNATGVLVHTNLGRVPLAAEAMAAIAEVGAGYSNLEYELAEGRRGHRHEHLADLLCSLTGAEDALVVNNNAGALLLALSAHAAGRETVVSRGELVEIGGGFRIPEVVERSGSRLVEVGTTNRTRAADYANAVGPNTAVLLKVHRSNFAITGFTAEVEVGPLAELARKHAALGIYDAGSGAMEPIAKLAGEHPISDHVAAGMPLVTFSGDKLLGGPQAGIAVGTHAAIDAMRRAPLYRALRPDKLTIAALGATLALWRDAPHRIPLVRMLTASAAELEARSRALLARVSATGAIAIVPTIGRIGGGAAPSVEIESRAIAVGGTPDAICRALRAFDPPIIARIEGDAVLLDLRAVPESEDPAIASALSAVLGSR